MNRVLVLCQRKTGRINKQTSENVSKQINPAIEGLVSEIIESPKELCRFEYMSPGLVELDLDGTADYRFELDNKQEKTKKQTEKFIKENLNQYKAVVFHTCPILFLKHTVFLVYSLLEENGLLIIMAITKESKNKVSINKIDVTKKGLAFQDFVNELNKYFEPTDQPFIYKKK
jgi:hypothetical protein